MRLRKMVNVETGRLTYKLAKKYGARFEDGIRWEPIVNVYLDESEYQMFSALAGQELRKRRHLFEDGDIKYGIDVFESGLILLEAEYPTIEAARVAVPPGFAGREITGDSIYECASLSRAQ